MGFVRFVRFLSDTRPGLRLDVLSTQCRLISSHSLRGSTWSGLSVQAIGELYNMGLCLS